jgi:hypothetical protein
MKDLKKVYEHYEYAIIPIKYASEYLIKYCNSSHLFKVFFNPSFVNEQNVYEYDDSYRYRNPNALLIVKDLFDAYEQDVIENEMGGIWYTDSCEVPEAVCAPLKELLHLLNKNFVQL